MGLAAGTRVQERMSVNNPMRSQPTQSTRQDRYAKMVETSPNTDIGAIPQTGQQ